MESYAMQASMFMTLKQQDFGLHKIHERPEAVDIFQYGIDA